MIRVLILACLLPSLARAGEEEARSQYQHAQTLFDQGSYAEALAAYRESYRLSKYTTLLYFMAQCRERLGQFVEARALYEEFLAAEPNSERRAAVEARIHNLQRRFDEQAAEQRARDLFAAAQLDFTEQRYQEAYDRFRQAYAITHAPQLRYDMGSALEALGRPHAAAEELRGYLRARPDEPNQETIEGRIRALDEAQRQLDAERLKSEPPKLLALPAPEPYWNKKRITIVAAVAAGVAAIALGVGLGVGLSGPSYSSATLGAHRGTP